MEPIQCAINNNSHRGYPWELIVCDNQSTDETELEGQVVFELSLPISKARNSGASIANGHWFLFIDADTYPCPELLAAMLDLIESGM